MTYRRLLSQVALAAAISLAPLPALAQSARVIDGDTLAIGKVHFRLYGIDAPEKRQPCLDGAGQTYSCGLDAKATLQALIGGQSVACIARDRDRYGRTVAVCIAGGKDLGAEMVRAGMALAYLRYSSEYQGEQDAAHDARRGIWRGQFISPWDWRRR